jgi:hypothetical protein
MRIDYLYNPGGGHPRPAPYTSTAAENDVQVKTAGGILQRIQGYTATSQFLQVHNSPSTPGEGAVPVWSQAIAATWNFNEATFEGVDLSKGIYVCVSTTQATKTLGGNDTWFNISAL